MIDAESATALVNPLLETMVELMVQHGGRIDRFLGDGVLAVFGVPAAHEDDPIRAVHAGLMILDAVAELGQTARLAPGIRLQARVGIHTGLVVAGEVGAGENPTRVELQNDERYLWVGNNSTKDDTSGVTVIDADSYMHVAFIPTGKGHHEIAFREDDKYAFVSNRGQHWLRVTQRSEARLAPLDEIIDRVRLDWITDKEEERLQEQVDRLWDNYTIIINDAAEEH